MDVYVLVLIIYKSHLNAGINAVAAVFFHISICIFLSLRIPQSAPCWSIQLWTQTQQLTEACWYYIYLIVVRHYRHLKCTLWQLQLWSATQTHLYPLSRQYSYHRLYFLLNAVAMNFAEFAWTLEYGGILCADLLEGRSAQMLTEITSLSWWPEPFCSVLTVEPEDKANFPDIRWIVSCNSGLTDKKLLFRKSIPFHRKHE